jgi:hypothetical protein
MFNGVNYVLRTLIWEISGCRYFLRKASIQDDLKAQPNNPVGRI